MSMRLPAHGRALVEARRAGRHPVRVDVVYGPRIPQRALHGDYPVLGVLPDWESAQLDWRCTAGCIVLVYDESQHAGRLADWWLLDVWRIGAAIADYAANVYVHQTHGDSTIRAAAHGARLAAGAWPDWWSDARDERVANNIVRHVAWVQRIGMDMAERRHARGTIAHAA